ncbi:hypothetical protein ACIAMG_09835, partial [Acinetobacter baumannii]|uniref:hypothetical protein n=1 Tax=Acinetobacter baumannii TaxID=470 RepID=UPI00379CBDFB
FRGRLIHFEIILLNKLLMLGLCNKALFFWLLTLFTSVVAVPKTIFNTKKRARWVSPDRGFRGDHS